MNNTIKPNTHKVAKGINSRLLTGKGVNIGNLHKKVKGKTRSIEILKLDGLFQGIKDSLMGSYWKLLDISGIRKATLTKVGKYFVNRKIDKYG